MSTALPPFNAFRPAETALDVFRRLHCPSLSLSFTPNTQKIVNFGDFLEIAVSNHEKHRTIIHASATFARTYPDGIVFWLSCGSLQAQVFDSYVASPDVALLKSLAIEGRLKSVTIENSSELLAVVEVLCRSVGTRKVLVVAEGLSLLLQGQRALHKRSANAFVQCLGALSKLCEERFAMCMWISTYMHNKSGTLSTWHSTSPAHICAANGDPGSMIAVQWKSKVKSCIQVPL